MMALTLKSTSQNLRVFLLIFGVILSADQFSKHIMLDLLFDPLRYVEVNSVLNFVPVWNSGMSFGFLSDGGIWVRIGLTVLAFLVS